MSGYPDYLIPNKSSENFTQEKIRQSKVGRWHDVTDSESIFGANNSIKSHLIDYHRFPRFSCNLMPPSNCEDLKIKLLNSDLEKPYEFDSEPVEVVDSDYEYDNNREVIELDCNKVQSEKLPYTIGNEEYVMTIQIVHSPLVANFPHCEFKLLASHTGEEVKKLSSSKKWHRILTTSLRGMFEKYGKKCSSS